MPRICTFRSDDAPEHERWIACFYAAGRRAENRLPLVIAGRTKEIVVAAAENWWAQEVAKEAARREESLRRAERRRAA